jgi:hypothetical protein
MSRSTATVVPKIQTDEFASDILQTAFHLLELLRRDPFAS